MNLRTPILVGILSSTLLLGCMHDDDSASTTSSTRARSSTSQGDERARADDTPSERRVDHAEPVAPDPSAPGSLASAGSAPPDAMDQSESSGDLEITRQVRQRVVNDSSLSIMAHNVTIVTRSGVVTLRGNVSSTAERSAVERHARAVQDVSRVDNLLAVRP